MRTPNNSAHYVIVMQWLLNGAIQRPACYLAQALLYRSYSLVNTVDIICKLILCITYMIKVIIITKLFVANLVMCRNTRQKDTLNVIDNSACRASSIKGTGTQLTSHPCMTSQLCNKLSWSALNIKLF